MCVRAHSLSCSSRVQLFATPWTIACQAPVSMGFSRQGYWNGLLCSSPGDLPNPGIKPEPPMSPALACGFLTTSATWEAQFNSKWSEWSRSFVSNSLHPMGYSLTGFAVHGIFQARVLDWLAISFSRGSSRPRDQTQVSCITGRHFTLWATREAR